MSERAGGIRKNSCPNIPDYLLSYLPLRPVCLPSGLLFLMKGDVYARPGGNYVIDMGIIEKGFSYKYNCTDAVLTYQGGTQVKWKSSDELKMKFNVNQANSTATLDVFVKRITRAGSVFSANRTSPLLFA